MAHPRKQSIVSARDAASGDTRAARDEHDARARQADPAQAAADDREFASDRLVQLMAAYYRDRIDWSQPRWQPLLEWMRREAIAALSPAERAALHVEAAAFGKRIMALPHDAPDDREDVDGA